MGTGFREVGFGFDEPQAHVVKARLDDAGIWSDVRPADSSSLGAFAIGAFFACSVRVRESDYDRAVDLLRTGSVDWDTVDVGEGEDHTVAAIARMSDEEAGARMRRVPMWLRVAGAVLGGVFAAKWGYAFFDSALMVSAVFALVAVSILALVVTRRGRTVRA